MHLLSQNTLLYLFLSCRISKHFFFFFLSGSADNSIYIFFIFIKIPFFIGNKLPFTVRETRECIIKSRKASDLSVGAGLEGTVKAICHQLRRVGASGGCRRRGRGFLSAAGRGAGPGGPAGGPAPVPAAARGYGCGARQQRRPGGARGSGGTGGGVAPPRGPGLERSWGGGDVRALPQLWGQRPPGGQAGQREEPRGGSGPGPAAFSGAGARGKRRRSGGRAGGRRGGRSRARPRHAGVEGRWQDRNRRVVGLRGRAPRCRGIPAPGTSRVASFSVVFAQNKEEKKNK